MGALLALAFGAGVIAPLNPCGIALLPAYLTYHLDVATRSGRGGPPAAGLKAGAALTVGFAGTLAVLAGAVSLGPAPCSPSPPGRAWPPAPCWPCSAP